VLYIGADASRIWKAPPGMKSITGKGDDDDWFDLGVKIFKYKQSSENYEVGYKCRKHLFWSIQKFTVKGHIFPGIIHGGWGQAGALEVALSSCGAHLVTGTGGFHLKKFIFL